MMLSGGYGCQVVTSSKKDHRLMVRLPITCVQTPLIPTSTKPSLPFLERCRLLGNKAALTHFVLGLMIPPLKVLYRQERLYFL